MKSSSHFWGTFSFLIVFVQFIKELFETCFAHLALSINGWRNYRSSLKWHKKCKIISFHCFHCIGLEIKFRTLSDTAEPWAADWWRVEPGPAPVPGSPSGRYTEHRNSHHSGAHFLDLVCVILPDSNIFWAEIHPTPIIMDKFSAVTEAPFIHQKVTSSDRCI